MLDFAAAPLTDLAVQLQRGLYHHVAHTLRRSLPPPPEATPESSVQRDRAAIALVASLAPANADEVVIAAQYVAANAHAMQCLSDLCAQAADPVRAAQLNAQARSMMREARGARSLLLRMQAARRLRERDGRAVSEADWMEHIAQRLLAEALGHTPHQPDAASAEPTAPNPDGSEHEPNTAAHGPVAGALGPVAEAVGTDAKVREPNAAVPRASSPAPPVTTPGLPAQASSVGPIPRQPAHEAEPAIDFAAEAERYAILYPQRAELIRALGHVPDDARFGPPEPELVQAIINGTGPALRGLDRTATTS